jgi:hypothetical protein
MAHGVFLARIFGSRVSDQYFLLKHCTRIPPRYKYGNGVSLQKQSAGKLKSNFY